MLPSRMAPPRTPRLHRALPLLRPLRKVLPSRCRSAALPHGPMRARAALSSTSAPFGRGLPDDGKGLRDFVAGQKETPIRAEPSPSYEFTFGQLSNNSMKFYIETMGCQMNVSDSEIVNAILEGSGFRRTVDVKQADIIFVNTCSIRENAEKKVWDRLNYYNSLRRKRAAYHKSINRRKSLKNLDQKVRAELPEDQNLTPTSTRIGVLGCMAERLKTDLLESEQGVDLVVGPDAYRDLPNLLQKVTESDDKAMNVLLSTEETYADISPVRLGRDSLTAFVSIMRGCNNMCSYCIVPYTRGRERSREAKTILDEISRLRDDGCKEVTLLGQNVNSYNYLIGESKYATNRDAKSKDFTNIAKPRVSESSVDFTELCYQASLIDPELRIRFTSPHPKDFPDDLIHLIAERPNICSNIHLPAQSGSSGVLAKMRRGYNREAYMRLVEKMRMTIPDLTLSTDIIVGFCGETEEDHALTMDLMETVLYDQAFMFKYSTRERTHAHRKFADDVPEHIKDRRLTEVIRAFYSGSERKNLHEIGKEHLILVEGPSKKDSNELVGRSCRNKKLIFPTESIPLVGESYSAVPQRGDYVVVEATKSSAQSLRGKALRFSSMQSFYSEDAKGVC